MQSIQQHSYGQSDAMQDTAMVLESGKSAMVIGSGDLSGLTPPSSPGISDVPSFRAVGAVKMGNLAASTGLRVGADDGRPGTSLSTTGSPFRLVLRPDMWQFLERGLRQRFEAISACMDEIVSRRKIPALFAKSSYLPSAIASLLGPVQGAPQAGTAWTWFGSTDLHLASNGDLTVLDHGFSLPTGLERLARNDDAGGIARDLFSSWASRSEDEQIPGTVVLDPGFFSATFRGNEFLARCLNAHLARSSDLTITSDGVLLKAGQRFIPISTIVRRIDDGLLDPNCLRPDSLVGLPGLVRAWKRGIVEVLSPPGSGIANSRSFGRLIPGMIREFLGEEPLLQTVAVRECGIEDELQAVIANPRCYAIRTNDPRHPARPYFGRGGTASEFASQLSRVRANSSTWVARPLLPESQDPGIHIRLFAASGKTYSLLRAGIGRECQPDGGAPISIGNDAATFMIE